MAQKREKDETLELKVPSDAPLSLSSSSSCPDNCKISGNPPGCPGSSGPDPARIDPGCSEKAAAVPRSSKVRPREEEAAEDQAVVEERGRRLSDGDAAVAAVALVRKAVNRCSGCGKRVGLTGFRCRCGDLFCSQHRYSDRHDCSFDYKAAGREAIARENPVVRAAKILKV